MAIIEPVRQDAENPSHIKKNSFNLRLWHWLNAIVISGLLTTVLINSTILDRDATMPLINRQIKEAKLSGPTNDLAKSISHELGDSVWQVHIYFGYVLAALLLYRLFIEPLQPADQRFFKKLKQAIFDYRHHLTDQRLARHELVVKSIYVFFYLLLIVMVATGLSLAFKSALGISRNISHSIKEVHGFCMYLVLAFIAVHIVGVLLAERNASPGIISDMINGGKNEQVQ